MINYCKNLWEKYSILQPAHQKAKGSLILARGKGASAFHELQEDLVVLEKNLSEMEKIWNESLHTLPDGRQIFGPDYETLTRLALEMYQSHFDNGHEDFLGNKTPSSILENLTSPTVLTVLKNNRVEEMLFNQNTTLTFKAESLKYLTSLKSLSLSNSFISDISFLKSLKNLEILELASGILTDFSPIADLVKLKSLHLGNTSFSDLSLLKKLDDLEKLCIFGTKVEDLSPLTSKENLSILFLTRTNIRNLNALANLPELRYVEIMNCENLEDISALLTLPNLKQVRASNSNKILSLPEQRAILQKLKETGLDISF